MKLVFPIDRLFSAEIDVHLYEDEGIYIYAIDKLSLVIADGLRKKGLNVLLNPDHHPVSAQLKAVHELVVDEAFGLQTVVEYIRAILDSEKIDWCEPYSLGDESDFFRFITPNISICHETNNF